MVVYFDNILIFSKSKEAHLDHLKYVMRALCNEKICVNLKKCTFLISKVIFLGFVVLGSRSRSWSREDKSNHRLAHSQNYPRSGHLLLGIYSQFQQHRDSYDWFHEERRLQWDQGSYSCIWIDQAENDWGTCFVISRLWQGLWSQLWYFTSRYWRVLS